MNVLPSLVFKADEISFEPTLKKKFIVLKICAKSNPYIILPNIQNCPKEIQKTINYDHIWCAYLYMDDQTETHFYYLH